MKGWLTLDKVKKEDNNLLPTYKLSNTHFVIIYWLFWSIVPSNAIKHLCLIISQIVVHTMNANVLCEWKVVTSSLQQKEIYWSCVCIVIFAQTGVRWIFLYFVRRSKKIKERKKNKRKFFLYIFEVEIYQKKLNGFRRKDEKLLNSRSCKMPAVAIRVFLRWRKMGSFVKMATIVIIITIIIPTIYEEKV